VVSFSSGDDERVSGGDDVVGRQSMM